MYHSVLCPYGARRNGAPYKELVRKKKPPKYRVVVFLTEGIFDLTIKKILLQNHNPFFFKYPFSTSIISTI